MPGGRSDPIGPSQLSASVVHHTGAQLDRGPKTINMPCIPNPTDPEKCNHRFIKKTYDCNKPSFNKTMFFLTTYAPQERLRLSSGSRASGSNLPRLSKSARTAAATWQPKNSVRGFSEVLGGF